MSEEISQGTRKLPKSTRNIILVIIGIVVLAILFRHSAVVRDIAFFVFSVPLAIIGFQIGKILRDFVMPDLIITNGGFGGLLKAKLFWMAGPQAIGAFLGLVIASSVVQKIFTPLPPPLSTVKQAEKFDGDNSFDIIKSDDVHKKILNSSIVIESQINPSSFYDLIKNDMKFGNQAHVEEVGLGGISVPYLAISGCEKKNCQSNKGAFVVIYGSDPDDIAYIAVSSENGIQELPAPFSETFSNKILPDDAYDQFESWKEEVISSQSASDTSTSLSSKNDKTSSILAPSLLSTLHQSKNTMTDLRQDSNSDLSNPTSTANSNPNSKKPERNVSLGQVGTTPLDISISQASAKTSQISTETPTAPLLSDTILYTQIVKDCHSIQLDDWQHPVRNVLEKSMAKIEKVELCNGNVYPIFTVYLPSGRSFAEGSKYYNELLENIARANGWWSYAIVDKTNNTVTEISINKRHQLGVESESFSD